ncbi:uncharacterized protein LOC134281727 [Saccostrea cucullata]|uniref:uncharacterized protein LOC134281727 n=1 Tax=Saccostrea cuccullata TaxID=36930 RepID=UPI002ED161A3
MKNVTKLLSEIKIKEEGKRQIESVCQLQLMSKPTSKLQISLTGVSGVTHISTATPDHVWFSDGIHLFLANVEGHNLHHLKCIRLVNYGIHTVNMTCDLIYIDRDYNIKKFFKDTRSKSTLMKKRSPWLPLCVVCSPSNNDLLVGMLSTDTWAGKVTRYNNEGKVIQTIQHDTAGQQLYCLPRYITENRNGDVIVSDLTDIDNNDYGRGAVVVIDYKGRHRFSYTGHPSESDLLPHGICTDTLSNILLCDSKTNTIHLIDKDGHFMMQIQTQDQGIGRPMCLSFDHKNHLLWIGSCDSNKVCVYRYIERKNYLKNHCDD